MWPPRVYTYARRRQEEIVLDDDIGGPVRVGMPASELDKKIKRGVNALKAGCGTPELAERGFKTEEIRRVLREAGMARKWHGR